MMRPGEITEVMKEASRTIDVLKEYIREASVYSSIPGKKPQSNR